MERSPFKYQLTRSIASLSPIEIATISDETLITWLNALVAKLHESRWIAALEAEKAEKQCKTHRKQRNHQKMKKFDMITDRVDSFLMEVLSAYQNPPELTKVIKIVLIILHGNVRVESGFSVNKDILLTNMMERTVIAVVVHEE